MIAGKLRDEIIFEKRVAERDEIGQVSQKWVEVCRELGQVRDNTGKEYSSSQTEFAKVDCTILIRYREGITADMRAVCDGVYYSIDAVLTNFKKDRIQLPCKKGVRYEV